MAPPPTKKQKRVIVLSSDDESTTGQSLSTAKLQVDSMVGRTARKSHRLRDHGQALPTRSKDEVKVVKPQKTIANSSLRPRPVSPSRKSRDKSTMLSEEQKEHKSGPLYKFFNTVTQSQRIASRPDASLKLENIQDDLIQDDSPDEDLRSWSSPGRKSEQESFNGGKRLRKPASSNGIEVCKEIHPNASQRFSKAVRRQSTTKRVNADLRPWAEKYAPSGLDELAVHKKKVTDVQKWLDEALTGRNYKALLILKGPSGTGKTATVSALAKSMNFDIMEWSNPLGTVFTSENFLSMSTQFEDFLGRSGKFGTLQFKGSEVNTGTDIYRSPALGVKDKPKKIILMEEFPNTFTHTSNALHSFRHSVVQYLAATASSKGPSIAPLIMIISETLTTSTTAANDSFTAHRLLGSEILTHPGTNVIEFNPVAPTLLTKALDKVIQKEARQSGRRRTPGTSLLNKLGEVGDIRSAIGSLEFLCIRDDASSDWSGRVAMKFKKGAKNIAVLTKLEQESIEMVTQREASLGIFHAVGKVVHNKRDEDIVTESRKDFLTQPPDHLSHFARPKSSQVSVDELINETGTDTQTFISALHENYIPSCNGPCSIESINGCIEALSDSDILGSMRDHRSRTASSHRGSRGTHSLTSGNDALRQDDLCFHVAVRGLLFALPYPVMRRAAPMRSGGQGSSTSDAFKMFYPTSLKLWKQMEEIEGLIERWIIAPTDQSEIHELAVNNPAPEPGSVETWSKKLSYFGSEASSRQESVGPSMISRKSARIEMILERLPYVAKIARQGKTFNPMRELEKMTQFQGIDAPNDSVPEEEDDDKAILRLGSECNTEVQSDLDPAGPANPTWRDKSVNPAMHVGRTLEKLVPSDDDIEDA